MYMAEKYNLQEQFNLNPNLTDNFNIPRGDGYFKECFVSYYNPDYVLLKFKITNLIRAVGGLGKDLSGEDIENMAIEYMEICQKSSVKLPQILPYCDLEGAHDESGHIWLMEKVDGFFEGKNILEQRELLKSTTDNQIIQIYIDTFQFMLDTDRQSFFDFYGQNMIYTQEKGFGFIDPMTKSNLKRFSPKLITNIFFVNLLIFKKIGLLVPSPQVFARISLALSSFNSLESLLDKSNEEVVEIIGILKKLQK
jgi:hypothetical protein